MKRIGQLFTKEGIEWNIKISEYEFVSDES